MFLIRKLFYRLVNRLSDDIETYENFTALDSTIVRSSIWSVSWRSYPYFRGMIAEIGLPHTKCSTSSNGVRAASRRITSTHSTISPCSASPTLQGSFAPGHVRGFAGSLLSTLVGTAYFTYKLFFWKDFTVGIAPIAIGMFFLDRSSYFSWHYREYIGISTRRYTIVPWWSSAND